MAKKPIVPNYTKTSSEYQKRVERYLSLLKALYVKAEKEFAKLALQTGYEHKEQFFFEDYPQTKKKADRVVNELALGIERLIGASTESEWIKSQENSTDLVKGLLFNAGITNLEQVSKSEDVVKFFNNHEEALNAFEKRRAKGLNLSTKVWNLAEQDRLESQLAISIADGTSADELSRQIRNYLNEPHRLYRRVRDQYGELRLSKNAKAYSPGAGVYRSSYKNAARLARNEINLAYKESEQTRWQDLDFVVGYEVKRSTNEYECDDMCEQLKGKYPKTFRFRPWHVNCRCFVVPILMTKDEMRARRNAIINGEEIPTGSVNEVKDVPDNFKKWIDKNGARIEEARDNDKLPYFIRDNEKTVTPILAKTYYADMSDASKTGTMVQKAKYIYQKANSQGDYLQSVAEEIASENGAYVTPINYKTVESIARKCRTEGMLPSELKDAVRNTIIVPDRKDIDNVLTALENQTKIEILRHKVQVLDTGYTGHIFNVKLPNGSIGEIQVNTEAMIYAKNDPKSAKRILGVDTWEKIFKHTGIDGGLGHKYYEIIRTSKDLEEIERLKAISREYYSHFQY